MYDVKDLNVEDLKKYYRKKLEEDQDLESDDNFKENNILLNKESIELSKINKKNKFFSIGIILTIPLMILPITIMISMLQSEDLKKILMSGVSFIYMFALIIMLVLTFIINNKTEKLKKIKENQYNLIKNKFNEKIRKITLSIIENIEKSNIECSKKNKFIDMLVEENYLLEKNDTSELFENLKEDYIINNLNYNQIVIENKRIKYKEETIKEKFNFLLEKDNKTLINK